MDIRFYVSLTVYLCSILHPIAGQKCSNISFPATLTIPEATPAETSILEINVTDSATEQWILQNPGYFQFSYASSIYRLTLTKKIVVECQKEKQLKLNFGCGGQTQEMVVSVRFTDMYPPTWITSKVKQSLTVEESVLPGTAVLNLNEAVLDDDCYDDGNVINVVPYTVVVELDASEYFAYNDTSKQVYLSRQFDYDKRYCDFGFKSVHGTYFFKLILYPETNPTLSSQVTINVTFMDVDDEPPVFLESNDCTECLSVCKSTSQSQTVHLENGIQKNFTFETMARDFDTKDENLEYTIVEVKPTFLLSYVDVNAENGTVSLHLSPEIMESGNETSAVDKIDIILQVTERHSNQTSDNMTITFIVSFPTPPTTIALTTTVSELTTTFEFTPEITSDLQKNMTEISTLSKIATTIEGSENEDLSSTTERTYSTVYIHSPSTAIQQLVTRMTTEAETNSSQVDTGYDEKVATVLMIVVISVGSLIVLVIIAYITYKCRNHQSNSSYVMQPTSIEAKL